MQGPIGVGSPAAGAAPLGQTWPPPRYHPSSAPEAAARRSAVGVITELEAAVDNTEVDAGAETRAELELQLWPPPPLLQPMPPPGDEPEPSPTALSHRGRRPVRPCNMPDLPRTELPTRRDCR